MGLRRALATLAGAAPAPVFAAVGRGAREAVQDLRLRPEVRLVDTPRHAAVLLVAGGLPGPLARAALRVHDELPQPRGTVCWTPRTPANGSANGSVNGSASLFPHASRAGPGENVVAAVTQRNRELLRGRGNPEPPLQPDAGPAPWRGVGPYGQGGKGMTGGVPYGRPMAGRGPDRDGLELDQLPVRIGPFFPAFPPGLLLDVKLQGDVLQEVRVGENPFRPATVGDGDSPVGLGEASAAAAHASGAPGVDEREVLPPADPFGLALEEPVPIARLETARARHHLRWLAEHLRVEGRGALGLRVLRLANRATAEDVGRAGALCRLVQRTAGLGASRAGMGVVSAAELARRGYGPVARAAGLPEDVRMEDPAYGELGFRPIVHEGGDARARLRQRLAEIVQSLELAGRAGQRRTRLRERVESPRGLLTRSGAAAGGLLALVPAALADLEWGDAVTAVVSFDLDLEAAEPAGAGGARAAEAPA